MPIDVRYVTLSGLQALERLKNIGIIGMVGVKYRKKIGILLQDKKAYFTTSACLVDPMPSSISVSASNNLHEHMIY
jgi:hypothetical protein